MSADEAKNHILNNTTRLVTQRWQDSVNEKEPLMQHGASSISESTVRQLTPQMVSKIEVLTKTDLTMCSFDIVSLFINVPLEETIQICMDTLHHSDLNAPQISEDEFLDLMLLATKSVGFSYGDMVYKEIDDGTMGSPLGLILANVFVGFYESKLFNSDNREISG